MDQNVKIPGRGLYSQRLEVVAWLDDVQLIFWKFWLGRGMSRCLGEKRTTDKCGKLEKLTERLLAKLDHSNFAEYSFLPSNLVFHKLCGISFLKTLFAIGFPYKH